jgi:hypothetical protein
VRAVLAGEPVARRVEERIAIPPISRGFGATDPGRAREIQKANGEKFQRAFERGLAVTGFERSQTEGIYLLEPWP